MARDKSLRRKLIYALAVLLLLPLAATTAGSAPSNLVTYPAVSAGTIPVVDEPLEPLAEDLAITFLEALRGRNGLVSQSFVEDNRDLLRVSAQRYQVEEEFSTRLPDGLKQNLLYDAYPMAYDYFLVTTSSLNVRQEPTTLSPSVYRLNYFDKVNAIQAVRGEYLKSFDSDLWYRVFWHADGGVKMGFVFAKLGEIRSFQMAAMFEGIKTLKQALEHTRMGYISNYREIHGVAPAYNGGTEDAYGISRNQSAPGYEEPGSPNFRYFSDGMLVTILDETADLYLVSTPSFKWNYWVPRNYIILSGVPAALTQAIVIDDTNQNEAVFQLVDEQWQLISYTFATTGIQQGSHYFGTPKGYFVVAEKLPYFWYVKDGTSILSGYAPYAIRFSGGGYIHGVPVGLLEGQTRYDVNPADPAGYQEYLSTIGTTPRSHKCVRNFTSHAKFIYNWLKASEGAIIVIK